MEAFSFCCHVYGVGEFFGSNRPFSIIWCVFSSIFKNTLPLCLEDGLSLSRNGICGSSGGCLSLPTLSGSIEISCEDRCASISMSTCELLSPAYMWGSLGGCGWCVIIPWQSWQSEIRMPTRGACSCEWKKKAGAVEKASAVERAGDAVEKVAAADNPRARGILSTRMGSTTTSPDSCKRSSTAGDPALIFWIKSLAARTMAFASGSNAVSCNSDSNCCVGDSTCFVTPPIKNKSVIG